MVGSYPWAADPDHSLCGLPRRAGDNSMPKLPLIARLYVVAVVASACVLISLAVYHRPAAMDIVVMLAILHIVGESLLARGSRDMLSISLGSVTSLAAIPMVGGWGAILVTRA